MSLHDDMSRIADELRASYDRRVSAVDALQQATQQQLAALHTQHQALAAAQRQQLKASTSQLRQTTGQFIAGQVAARRAMASTQRQQLDSAMATLRQRTEAHLARAHAARQALRTDQVAARQAWRQFYDEMQRRRAGHG